MQQVPRTIVVLLTSAIGDALLAVPILQQVRAAYSGARLVGVFLRGATCALIEELGLLDERILLRGNPRRSVRSLLSAIWRVRGMRPDWLLVPFSSHGTLANIIGYTCGARVTAGVSGGSLVKGLSCRVPVRLKRHRVDHNLDILRGIDEYRLEVKRPTGRYLPAIEDISASEKPLVADGAKPSIVICCGSDPQLAGKRWPVERWGAFCRQIGRAEFAVLAVGAANEHPMIEAIRREAGEDADIRNIAGETSFADLAALMLHAKAIVGSDGMLLHLAASLGVPLVGLFGPTDPLEGGPYELDSPIVEIVRSPAMQTPVYTNLSVGKGIPDSAAEAMRAISPESVFSATNRVMVAAAKVTESPVGQPRAIPA